ncbi:MAG: NosD domain-containing protein [Candidatus Sifarchaeia archaeon]
MRKRSIYIIVSLAILLMIAPQSSVVSTSSVEEVRVSCLASDTLYIDSDYTFTEDISTPIEVIADNVVIDGAGYSLLGPGGETNLNGLTVFGRSKVIIKNIVVEGWDRGIVVYEGYKNEILYNTIRYCVIGVDVTLCEKTKICGNIASENSYIGFLTAGCLKDHYQGNTADYNVWTGFLIMNSQQSRFIDNTAVGNGVGIPPAHGNGFLIADHSTENYFTGNYASDTGRCYWLHTTTHHNTLSENYAYNSYDGFHLFWSNQNDLITNTVYDCGNAFYLQDSSHNHIEDNCIDNTVEYGGYGVMIASGESNVVINNIVNHVHMGYWIQRSDYNILTGNKVTDTVRHGFWVQCSNYNTLEGNVATKVTPSSPAGSLGFEVSTLWPVGEDLIIIPSTNNLLTDNEVTGYWWGYFLEFEASNNELVGNTALDCAIGFWLQQDCNGNILSENAASSNFEVGFWVHGISDCIFIHNTASGSSGNGFWIGDSHDNTFVGNTISDNYIGVEFAGESEFNYFSENTFEDNTVCLQFWDNSVNNYFYHNNFIANEILLWAWPLSLIEDNFLYHPDLFEGNYWSDYTGVDDGSGGRVAGDGIGDTDIPWHYDWYPFLNQDGWVL